MELRTTFMPPQFEVQHLQQQQQPRFSNLILPNYNELKEKHRHQSPYVLSLPNTRWINLQVHCNNDDDQRIQPSSFTMFESSELPDLSFSRFQVAGQDNPKIRRREFGRYVALEALADEEYWAVAWLRAEAHYEPVSYMPHIDDSKKVFAEKEFYALKKQCRVQGDPMSAMCRCFVAVKKDDDSFRRIPRSKIVGSVDLTVRWFLKGETYPGEVKRDDSRIAYDGRLYAYIANLCVTRLERRCGVATNMLYFAMDTALRAGIKLFYIHVNADNVPAQKLYQKIGFELL